MSVDKQRALQRQQDSPEHVIAAQPASINTPNNLAGSTEAPDTQTAAHAGVKPAGPAARRFSSSKSYQPAKCGALTKELLQQYAVSNTIMITVNDIVTVQALGRHWLRNVNAANITYWLMIATDQATATYLESLGVSRCVMLPGTEGRVKADKAYKWHDLPWIAATWRNTEASAKVGQTMQTPGANTLHQCLLLPATAKAPNISCHRQPPHRQRQHASHATSHRRIATARPQAACPQQKWRQPAQCHAWHPLPWHRKLPLPHVSSMRTTRPTAPAPP